MKYNIGDKVVIKTWEQMKEEFGTYGNGKDIRCDQVFIYEMERIISKIPNRVVTISKICSDYYLINENTYKYSNDMIDKLYIDSKIKQEQENKAYDIAMQLLNL